MRFRGDAGNPSAHPLDARDITKVYSGEGEDVVALAGVSLALAPAEFVALMGPSGCGKSTLLNIIACVDRATSGVLCIRGIDVSQLSDDELSAVRRVSIGYVFQFFNLLPTLSVAENVALPLVLSGARRRDAADRAAGMLAKVDLDGTTHRRPSALSGGQQQRAAIARALVHQPALVLADEPTGNLDTGTGNEILRLLRDVCHAEGAAILMATHSAEAASMADRVIGMVDGRIVP